MDYHVGVGGRQEGPFPETEVRRRIAAGELKETDVCWAPGWTEWRPVRDVLPDAFGAALSSPQPAQMTLAPPVLAPDPARPALVSRTDGLAITSLVLGCLSFVMCGIVTAIPAVICGHVSRANIRKYHGRLGGAGLALAGLILGYASAALTIVMFLIMGFAVAFPAMIAVRTNAKELASEANLRLVARASLDYAADHNGNLPARLEDIHALLGDHEKILDLPYTVMKETAGYELVPGITTSQSSRTIIAYEAVPRGDLSRAVAYLDGSVVVLADGDPELVKLLAPPGGVEESLPQVELPAP